VIEESAKVLPTEDGYPDWFTFGRKEKSDESGSISGIEAKARLWGKGIAIAVLRKGRTGSPGAAKQNFCTHSSRFDIGCAVCRFFVHYVL
jgi:hypothetical protein